MPTTAVFALEIVIKLVLKNESDAHGGFNGFFIITLIEKPYNRTEHSQGFFICQRKVESCSKL